MVAPFRKFMGARKGSGVQGDFMDGIGLLRLLSFRKGSIHGAKVISRQSGDLRVGLMVPRRNSGSQKWFLLGPFVFLGKEATFLHWSKVFIPNRFKIQGGGSCEQDKHQTEKLNGNTLINLG